MVESFTSTVIGLVKAGGAQVRGELLGAGDGSGAGAAAGSRAGAGALMVHNRVAGVGSSLELDTDSDDTNEKDALVSDTVPLGPAVMVVSGAVRSRRLAVLAMTRQEDLRERAFRPARLERARLSRVEQRARCWMLERAARPDASDGRAAEATSAIPATAPTIRSP